MKQTTVACVIVAGSGGRKKILDSTVIPSVYEQAFGEVIVVGSHHPPKDSSGFRYLFVPDLTASTLDALVKRDCGTLATDADVLVYLSDDHALLPGFGDALRTMIEARETGLVDWDVLVPTRYADHPELGRIRIPNGEEGSYCAGHCGVFRRWVVQHRPWTAQRHDRLWDLYSSHDWQRAGVKFLSHPELQILDVEPGATPWL